ncbi:TetR/AcrR family transcriptional regulator [bacterium]|nr:MAG: TetR/AcrR family transcriptional regulator [bacterium]
MVYAPQSSCGYPTPYLSFDKTTCRLICQEWAYVRCRQREGAAFSRREAVGVSKGASTRPKSRQPGTAARKAPGAQPKPKRLPPDERERLIVREAVAFFAARGFEGQTRELARRLGITQPLLYRYFPSKEALLDRVYQEVYLNRWNPHWEDILEDRTRPLEDRIVEFYSDYARAVLTYEWIRIFMFSGLRGMDLNGRYLTVVRDRIFARVIREIRFENALPSPAEVPISEAEFELVWSLHASIFYIGIRKWIYGLTIPDDVSAVVVALTTAFIEGVPAVVARLTGATATPRARAAARRRTP